MQELFKKQYFKKNPWSGLLLVFFIFGLLSLTTKFILAAPTVVITTPPAAESANLPTVIASSTADVGDTIESASYQIYPSSGSPSGSWYQCTANGGTPFGNNHVEFTCTVASLADGSYKMNIRSVDDKAGSTAVETSAFIVDRLAPVVSFDDLPNAPNPINYNNPDFTGSVADTLTSVTVIEYAVATASTTDPVSDPGGWAACSIGGSGLNVTFTCDPGTFANSVKGQEYRMHVRATDNVGNVSTYTNYYKFQVDTVAPTSLAITYPDAAGITMYGNHSYDIDWVTPVDAFELGSNPIDIEFSANGTFSDTTVVVSDHVPFATYSWTAPNISTANARIRITATDLAGNSVSVTSANAFTIVPYSAPTVVIDAVNSPYDATDTSPITFTAATSDPQGIVSALYRVGGSGGWTACSAADGTFDETSESVNCGPYAFGVEGNYFLEVMAYDLPGDSGSDSYWITYDVSAPSVDAGTLGTINLPTTPGASASDAYTSIASYSWSQDSGPGTISFGGGSNILNPSISADTVSGTSYVARLTVCDILSNCGSDTVSFIWTDQPLNFNVTAPVTGNRWAGGSAHNITWSNPGGAALDHFDIEYSINGGTNWFSVITDLSNVTTLYSWSVPYDDSENVIVRVNAHDASHSLLVSDDSGVFAIDSSVPTVDAGILGDISAPTDPGATASDNFDTSGELTYSWTKTSGPGSLLCSGGCSTLSPLISGTLTGAYVARLTATDRVGNSAYDEVSFNMDANPPNFSVLQPASGVNWRGTSTKSIIWTSSAGTSYYRLHYTTDNWVSSSTIVASTSGTATSSGLLYDWTLPAANSSSSVVRVVAYDAYGNSSFDDSGIFTIDSLPPLVDAGNFSNTVLGPTQPEGVSASDDLSGIASYAWTQVSGSGTITFTGGSNILDPYISADVPGIYTARLTVTDNVGYTAYDDVSFIFNTDPPTPFITSPGADVVWRGTTAKNIRWTISDPGDISHFSVDYSINGGDSWTVIDSNVASTSRLLAWTVPSANSTSSVMRVAASDVDGNTATTTSEFVIDSTAPVITIGDIGTTTIATSSGTTVVDNIDSISEVTYYWSAIVVPAGGTLIFSSSHTVMDPTMSGTVSGYYTAQLIAQDRAGHISTDTITFYWQGEPDIPVVTNPTSTVIMLGGTNRLIEWFLPEPDPGDLDHFNISYSVDAGNNWDLITSGIASTSRSYVWSVPVGVNSTSTQVKIELFDTFSNQSEGVSANFTIDSTAPVVNAGTMPSPISLASSSESVVASDNFDNESQLVFTWTVLSEPYTNATLTIDDTAATTTTFAGDVSGEYSALLSVSDRAGNIGTSSISFYWLNANDPFLTAPSTGDFLRGNATTTATWTLVDPGDLDHSETEYSIDAGLNWLSVDNNIASTSLSVDWLIAADTNSTSSLFRILTIDDFGNVATSTSGLFTIDSTPPTVSAGAFSTNVNDATAPGATASDNFDSLSELSYSWSKLSGPGTISFDGGANILNPAISANSNGDYVALLIVTDRAGNASSSSVSFTRSVSTGGGGGGGGSGGGGGGGSFCTSVTYGDWGACYDGYQYRSIISTEPSFCSPTAEQQAEQQRVCGGEEELTYCTDVVYGDWGACVNNIRYREILNRYPISCALTNAQASAVQSSCGDEGPFDLDALDVMEKARLEFTGEDKALVKRLMGQILIQVEDKGRAWYISAENGDRYYLGSPRNAFSVMSLIGQGIKNEYLRTLPIGIVGGSLTQDKDTDGDGLPNRLEEGIGSDPLVADTDKDGFNDHEEIINGYNPYGPGKLIVNQKFLTSSLGRIFIQVETNGEAWYVEPRTKKRYYLGRPLEAFGIMRQFGVGITNEDINKIPVGEFTSAQLEKITKMLEERKRKLKMQD